jgi:hypothetical protein
MAMGHWLVAQRHRCGLATPLALDAYRSKLMFVFLHTRSPLMASDALDALKRATAVDKSRIDMVLKENSK